MRGTMVIAMLLLLSGCNLPFVGDDEPEEQAKPKKATSAPVKVTAAPSPSEKVVAESPTDVCDNVDGKQEVARGDKRSVARADGKLFCFDDDAAQAYASELRNRALGIVEPLERSVNAGGSPQVILSNLVQVSCDQSAADFYFWGEANDLYENIVEKAPKGSLSREWPQFFMVAVAQGCS